MAAVSLQQQQADRDQHEHYAREYMAELHRLYARLWEVRRGKPAPLRCGRKSKTPAPPAELADRVAARLDVGRSEAKRLCKAFGLDPDERWAPCQIARLCTTCEACPFKDASVGCMDVGTCARSAAAIRGLDPESFTALYQVLPDAPASPGEYPPESFGQLLAEVRRHLELSPGSPFRLPDVPRIACEPRPHSPSTHGPPRDAERPKLAPDKRKGLYLLPADTTPENKAATSESTETLKPSTSTAARKPIAPPSAQPARLPCDPHRSFRRNPPGYTDSQLWAELSAIRAAPSNGENLSSRLDARFNLGGYSAGQICDRFDVPRDEREQRLPTSTLAVGELCPTARECLRDQHCHSRLGCKGGLMHIEKPQRLPTLPPLPAPSPEDFEPDSAS